MVALLVGVAMASKEEERLMAEESRVKQVTEASRIAAAQQASKFDAEMARMNDAIFPHQHHEKQWHHVSSSEMQQHYKQVADATAAVENTDKSYAKVASHHAVQHPEAAAAKVPAHKQHHFLASHDKAAVAKQADEELQRIEKVTESAFPNEQGKHGQQETAKEMEARREQEVESTLPARFKEQAKQARHELNAKLEEIRNARKSVNAAGKWRHLASRRIQKMHQAHRLLARSVAHQNHQAAPSHQKPMSSDEEIGAAGTDVVFLGAHQAGYAKHPKQNFRRHHVTRNKVLA
ncbi:hypothetical protein GUITHDRAFT_154310 [Guillardia theta CCMP2712]|uniref:Uncharacterized protein n=1 Tax=Guillardia theta (strain CCMP2712) TaxID=905079 RepID=L1IUC1_GUITC|nr:hypothetical protein GUITHDRAFT_154310 [Guillardia theta CCMP2712]EKX39841.1 hypothetical protein GUITHDRAFT_154310 [Guillardia theta CCMP2712]|eukprot:XP_005826821.1 hypothetical protein GUITHDRAFT_154310 [Guillardia theta CCMP2712]